MGILANLMERRFHVSQSPPGWVDKTFGRDTMAGIAVDEGNAMQYIAVFACIRILAETLSSLPLITYRRLNKGGKERAQDFYLYAILHDMVNPEMTAGHFRETMMGHVVGWGNAYAQIIWNGAGQVAELWPLRPDKMTVVRVKGQLQYIYKRSEPDENGKMERTFAAREIFHLPGLGFDGISGYSPIALARQGIALGLAAEEFGARFFGNDARPGVVLEHPNALSDAAYERLKKSVEEEHGGVSKSHKPMILEEGMKIETIGIPPEDAQFLQTRTFQLREMARLYRVPPHMLADLERATYNNVEELNQEFVDYTLLPWAVRWEQIIYKSLLTPAERKTYFAEHLMEMLLRGNITNRYTGYHTARMDGWMNADEIREKENMNPIPNGKGQTYLVPMNMVGAEKPGTTGGGNGAGARHAVPQQVPQAADALRELYLDTAGRILRREKNDVMGAARKYLAKRDFDGFSGWLDDFYEEHEEFIGRQLQPLVSSHVELVRGMVEEEDRGKMEAAGMDPLTGTGPRPISRNESEFVRSYLVDYAGRHAALATRAIKKIVKQGRVDAGLDVCAALEGEFEGWMGSKALGLADQERNALGQLIFDALERGTDEAK